VSRERLEQTLRELEQAKVNRQEQLAFFEIELSLTANPPQKFELQKRIQECDQEISRINAQLEFIKKDIELYTNQQKIQEKTKSNPQSDRTENGDHKGSRLLNSELQEINSTVQQVRSLCHDKIQQLYGEMHMLNIAQPVDLDDIYVDVNILEKLTNEQWLEISDLLKNYNSEVEQPIIFSWSIDNWDRFGTQEDILNYFESLQEIQSYHRRTNFDRLGLGKRQIRVPGLEAVKKYNRLMILGKPGSGKTTFLQYLIVGCNEGKFQANRVPIFIRLKTFAEDARDVKTGRLMSLEDYIHQEFESCSILELSVTQAILKHGRAIIMLDGLDEVLEKDDDEVIKQIRRFSQKYFKNQLIITCRIASQKYRFQEEKFTPVEIADFNQEQVESFARKWFVAFAKNNHKQGLAKADQFINKLYHPENKQIRELAITPILLNLICLVFQEKANFPSKRADLYETGLDILLVKWDKARNIRRDEVYRNLTTYQKKELLSQIAAILFKRGDYLFQQDKLQQLLADYLRTLPEEKTSFNELLANSEALLKSIETQHGLLIERARKIYSFSHLTFQEYFTAKRIVKEIKTLIIESDLEALKQIAKYVAIQGWQEVFLLVAEISLSIDELLSLKKLIDSLLASEEQLQQFLQWVTHKSISVKVSNKLAARAFYFTLSLTTTNKSQLDYSQACYSDICFGRNFPREGEYALDFLLASIISSKQVLARQAAMNYVCTLPFDTKLQQLLKKFANKTPTKDCDIFSTWAEELREVFFKSHRNVGNWQFKDEQRDLLEPYFYANKLLIDCLEKISDVSAKVKHEIKDTLFLPVQRC
jgi:predicted NACHT family NTPase